MTKSSKNRLDQIIETIRSEPQSADDLAELFNVSVPYIRGLMDQLQQAGIIHKTKNQRTVIYNITNDFAREMPRIKFTDSKGITKLGHLSHLLTFYRKVTTSEKALQNLPVLAAKLMMIGYRYQTLTQTISTDLPEFNKRRKALYQELSMLRLEITPLIFSLRQSLHIYQILKESEEFWQLESLTKQFDSQLDTYNNLISPEPIDKAMEITEGAPNGETDALSDYR